MFDWLKKAWCGVAHGGGRIDRDSLGRINWQCARCGRWSDYPVDRNDERREVDRHIEQNKRRSNV